MTPLFTLEELAAAERIVRATVPRTPSYAWPLLKARTGVEVIVKHENHTPTGSFKARGGLVYVDALARSHTPPEGIVTATRGNHGQSIAMAATRNGLPSVIVVPENNSVEKNAAMKAWGGDIVVGGVDFDACRPVAGAIAEERGYAFAPSFHVELVKGVATYAHELFADAAELDVVYVPIGMGSGVCGMITVRDLLGLKTEVVGVVAEKADAFAQSMAAGRPVATPTARTFADGVACREPQPEAFEIIRRGAARVVAVSEDAIAEAIRVYYHDTHNLAEGAGAAPLAALMAERSRYAGKRAGVILCGGNIDASLFAEVLAGRTPAA